MNKKYRVDAVLYQIGKIIWLPVLIAGSWFANRGYEQYGKLFECDIYNRTGLFCPGCGGTRAVYFLFCGELLKSVRYHPAVLGGVFLYLHFMLLFFFRKHIKKTDKEIAIEIYVYVLAAVIILQWIIKIFFCA